MGKRETDALNRPFRAALRECRRQFGYVLLFSAALNTLYLAPSLYMLQVYDRVLVTGGLLTLVFLSAILVVSLAVLAFLDATRGRILSAVARRLDRLLTPQILATAFAPRARAVAGHAQPIRDFDTVRGALSGAPALAVMDAPWAPLYIAICFLVHPWLGALALAGGVLLVVLALINERAVRGSLRDYEAAAATSYALQHADTAQADVARVLGMQDWIVRRQVRKRVEMVHAQSTFASRGAGYSASTKFVRLALQSAALGLGAYLAVQQEITAGGVIACTILTARAFAPLEQIVGAWRQFGQVNAAMKVVKAVLEAGVADARGFTELPAPRNEIKVENVRLRAPRGEGFILGGVSFRVQAGEITGVIGPSGAGKSSLMRVLVGAAAPDAGQVRLDGAKLSDWDSVRLGRYIGYLPQEIGLFAGTIAENISRFEKAQRGSDSVDLAVMAAAEAAGIHELVLGLPQGYDTVLEAGGRGLSAGQAQRVGLARALYRDPVLIVLDEPNANVDAEGEAALIAALKACQARGAIVLVVAHRAGFMNIADNILVLRGGQVDAFGPREEVMSKLNAQSGARPMIVPKSPLGART